MSPYRRFIYFYLPDNDHSPNSLFTRFSLVYGKTSGVAAAQETLAIAIR
jgi:hypothetical protein